MTVEFRFTDVGEGLAEGEVVEWLVSEGDTVARDQPMVAVETDKSVVELPAPVAATVVHIARAKGDTVKVGDLLVVLEPVPGAAPAAAPTDAPAGNGHATVPAAAPGRDRG